MCYKYVVTFATNMGHCLSFTVLSVHFSLQVVYSQEISVPLLEPNLLGKVLVRWFLI